MAKLPVATACAALAAFALLATAVRAQELPLPPPADAQAKRMVATFKDWTVKWGVANASLAVMRGDKVVGQAKVGGHKPAETEPVASLSKAITGVCVIKLVEAGDLKYGDRIGKLLPGYFKKNKPADAAAKEITVAELLTQTSGLNYDPTQGTAAFAALDFTRTNLSAQLALALERPLGPKTFFYNNVNFGALGMVIEAVSGKPYDKQCKKSVLDPAGVTEARLDPDWKIMASWGGWNISAIDYARFLAHFRPKDKLLRTKPPSWPKTLLNSGGAYYSVGTFLRESGGSWNFWHDGAWRWFDDARPERNENYGAYFAMWFQDLRFVANYHPQPPSGAVGDLDYSMYQAAYPAGAPVARIAPPAPADKPAGMGSDRGEESEAIARSYEAR
ncbi:serine hydrolase domain-containing protein [Hansschlegelia zhihuaiae]|nr:serine hydrolase domain-containing protein [Hansschlegelia zhihuaiae]